MVDPRPDNFEKFKSRGWTVVRMTKGLGCQHVMSNDYVHLSVFKWLSEHYGVPIVSIRNSKFEDAEAWAYCQPEYSSSIKGAHCFFFQDPKAAMMFKLMWV